MARGSLADMLLTSASQDALAFNKLADEVDAGDALVGFHAQQAVEKAIKAVLSHAGVVFRRTHDIAELLDLLADSSLAVPPHNERLDELNPYAVEMRYGLVEPGALDRQVIKIVIQDVLDWAQSCVESPKS